MPSRRRLLPGIAFVVVFAAVLSVPLAEHRALSAEGDYLEDRLENAPCLADWGTFEGSGPSANASVTGVDAFGLRVRITVPYSYRTRSENTTIHADTASRAVYIVSPVHARRVSGDAVSVCDQGSASVPVQDHRIR